MRNYWILTKIQLLSLFGINKIRFSGDSDANKKSRRNILMLLVLAVCFGNMSVVYSGAMATVLKPIGALPLMLGLMAMATSALVLLMTISSGKNVLFAFGDYDIQMSWPVSVREIAASRLTTLYAYNIVYTLLLMLPAGVIYAMHALPPIWYYPLFLVLTLFIGAVPTALGCLISILITVLTAGRRKRTLLTTAFQMVAILGFMFLSMRTSSAVDQLASVASALSASVGRMYPVAIWFQNALASGDIASLLLFIVASAAAIALVIVLIAAIFQRVSTRLMTHHHAGKAYRAGGERSAGMVTALFRKEIKRYFASTIYVTNTIFGVVLLIIGGVAALIFGLSAIEPVLNEIGISTSVLPLIIGVIVMMSCTTNSSISMEGKSLWIVKSLPIPVRELFLSKILVNLIVILLPCYVGSTLLGVALRIRGLDWLYLYLIPTAYVCFDAVFGLWLNLKLPKLDWKNETEVVKQSSACMITLMGGMAVAFVPIGVFIGTGWTGIFPVLAVVLFVLAAVFWRLLMKNGADQMLRL